MDNGNDKTKYSLNSFHPSTADFIRYRDSYAGLDRVKELSPSGNARLTTISFSMPEQPVYFREISHHYLNRMLCGRALVSNPSENAELAQKIRKTLVFDED